MAESASAAEWHQLVAVHRASFGERALVFPDTTEVHSRFPEEQIEDILLVDTGGGQTTAWPTDNPWLADLDDWERAIDNLCLHISRNLFSFLCRLEPFWGIGRLLVVLVAVRTAGSQWRFEIRRSETAAETRLTIDTLYGN
jgi:hypothetical protein